jgi:hypothetical protein
MPGKQSSTIAFYTLLIINIGTLSKKVTAKVGNMEIMLFLPP